MPEERKDGDQPDLTSQLSTLADSVQTLNQNFQSSQATLASFAERLDGLDSRLKPPADPPTKAAPPADPPADQSQADPAADAEIKAMQAELDELRGTTKALREENEATKAASAAQALDAEIDRVAAANGIDSPAARADFVAARRSSFRLGSEGLEIVRGETQIRSKKDPTRFMAADEYFDDQKVNAPHFFPTGPKGGRIARQERGAAGEGAGEGAGDDPPRIITDSAEYLALNSTAQGREDLKKKRVIYRPVAHQ